MRVQFGDLPQARAETLQAIAQNRVGGEGIFFLRGSRRWLAVMGSLCLGLGALLLWISRDGASAWPRPLDAIALPVIGVLALLYSLVAWLEWFRLLRSRLKPFLVLTPYHLVKCRGSHRPLDIYMLTEAAAFQRVNEYNGAAWTGQAYEFQFDDGNKIKFSLKRKADIDAANRVLELAARAGRGEPLPAVPTRDLIDLGPGYAHPVEAPGFIEKAFDPASETWLLVLGFTMLAFIPYALFR